PAARLIVSAGTTVDEPSRMPARRHRSAAGAAARRVGATDQASRPVRSGTKLSRAALAAADFPSRTTTRAPFRSRALSSARGLRRLSCPEMERLEDRVARQEYGPGHHRTAGRADEE